MARLKTLPSRLKMAGARVGTLSPGSWRSDKTTAAQRGYDHNWRKARLVHLQEQPLCVFCQRAGLVVAATVVDHIKAHQGDMALFWDRSNWQSLCAPCHSSVKQAEERSAF